MLGQFSDIEQDSMQLAGRLRQFPTSEESSPLIQELIDPIQLTSQQLIIMAELKQLRIGIFQQLYGSFRPGGGVIEERAIPPDHGQIIGIVGNAGLHYLIALAFGESCSLAAHDLQL